MEGILVGALVGMVLGFLIGLATAAFTRDGIWPLAWAYLVLVCGLCGAGFGALSWAFGG